MRPSLPATNPPLELLNGIGVVGLVAFRTEPSELMDWMQMLDTRLVLLCVFFLVRSLPLGLDCGLGFGWSKIGQPQHGILVSGNTEQNLWVPWLNILTDTKIERLVEGTLRGFQPLRFTKPSRLKTHPVREADRRPHEAA